MDDDQIGYLVYAVNIHGIPIAYINGSCVRMCNHVSRNWIEVYGDGSKADTPEPAMMFSDGSCVALRNVSPDCFYKIRPFFQRGETCPETK